MNNQYCEDCIRKFTIAQQQPQQQYTYPTMPYPQQQYTYATMPYPQQQQQQQQPQYIYASMPYQQPQQQRNTQIGTGTAVVGGFVLGAMLENMLDPSD
jgi:hypothetical protein